MAHFGEISVANCESLAVEVEMPVPIPDPEACAVGQKHLGHSGRDGRMAESKAWTMPGATRGGGMEAARKFSACGENRMLFRLFMKINQ